MSLPYFSPPFCTVHFNKGWCGHIIIKLIIKKGLVYKHDTNDYHINVQQQKFGCILMHAPLNLLFSLTLYINRFSSFFFSLNSIRFHGEDLWTSDIKFFDRFLRGLTCIKLIQSFISSLDQLPGPCCEEKPPQRMMLPPPCKQRLWVWMRMMCSVFYLKVSK